jgi:uncharacterized protein (TIGR02996 family)
VSPEDGFLRAICSEPEDDTPRLVYADYLEEHGDDFGRARAEFIRLQIDLARQKEDSPQRRERAFRARHLLDQYRARWLAPFQRFCLHDVAFARGFVEKVGLMLEDLLSHAGDLFGASPIRRLWVTELYGQTGDLACIPADNQLAELDLCGDMIDGGSLEVLARQSNLGRLRVLGLLFNDIDDAAARLLCELPFYRRLSLIRCGGNPLAEEARGRLTTYFGPRISFIAERDEDHLYAIGNDCFTAGFGRDHTQVLLYGTGTELLMLLFDHEGNLLGLQRRGVSEPARPAGAWQKLPMETRKAYLAECDANWGAVRKAWLEELDYQPATIRVKGFGLEGGWGIHPSPDGWVRVLSAAEHPERENALSWLDRWLAEGKFAFVFRTGGDWWLNREGEVTDT